eukprot:TRINITY_DN18743_c0_g1_i1.p1 TRINITY_DN18743_c0_g1~~TRINITY_DN18743_c0_g1_i1.p1  ORF type:complete len:923 (+),score=358.15 TRINITY_DN18743_c0_g1_i1:57-2771(+)
MGAVQKVVLLLACVCVSSVGGLTVAESIATSPELSRFWELLDETGVRDVLNSDEAVFTVFAPTNEAMREFMVPGVVGLLEKKPEYKKKLAAYHVVVAKKPLKMEDVPLAYAGMATSLWGTKLLLESNDVVRINGKAHVTKTDAVPDITNGMIHLVNGVLSYSGWFPEEDLITLLRKDSKLRAFYVTMWDVKDEIGLTDKGPLTVFVPSNKAFARAGLTLKGTSLNTLLEADRELIIRILRYHIVHSKYLTRDDLMEPGVAQTIDVHKGRANYVAYQRDGTGTVDINSGEAKLLTDKGSTVQATNGVYHVIDKLLLPPGVEVPDVNYSSTRTKRMSEALQATPEPPAIIAPTTPATQTKKKSPVFMILVIAAVILLAIHRLAAPPESHLDKRRRRPDIALALMLVLLCIVPLFSTMKWALPPGLRWASDEVRSALFQSPPPPAMPERLLSKASYIEQLDHMLNYLEQQMYRDKLIEYGLDRIDLIAIATSEDGERAGIKLGHWSKLQKEARKRHPVNADMIDITPEPPTEYTGRRPPAVKVNPEVKEELDKAGELARMFDIDSKTNKEELTLPPQTAPTLPPIVLNKQTAAEENLKKFVIAAIVIPSTGVSTIECTFGTRHGNFAHRDAAQLENVKYVRVQSLSEVRTLKASLGGKDYKDVSPKATVVTALVATRPVSRFIRSFHKSVGKTITPESDFKCEEKMRLKMKDPKFTLEDYVRLPDKARRLCEGSCNPMVKALTDLPLGAVAGPEHLEQAVRALKEVDVLMIDDDNEKKSMLGLLTKVNLTEGSYIPCSSYYDSAKIEYSLRASDIIARDNDMDRQLFSEIHHVFNTRYAGSFEMTVDAAKVECDQNPTVCFDENDRNGEKKAKDLFANVNATLRRASSQQGVMCAGYCRLPKDVFSV